MASTQERAHAPRESSQLKLEVATPTGLALSTTAAHVEAPSVDGEFGVYPGHLPLLAALKSGVLSYTQGHKKHVAAVGPGFVEAGPDKVLLLTDLFADATSLSEEAVRKDLDETAKALNAFKGDPTSAEREELQRKLEWAQAREAVLKLAKA